MRNSGLYSRSNSTIDDLFGMSEPLSLSLQNTDLKMFRLSLELVVTVSFFDFIINFKSAA